MPVVFQHTGTRSVLDTFIDNIGNLSLGLYTELVGGITRTTVIGDLVEPVFDGYARKLLQSDLWHSASTDGGVTSVTYRLAQTFTRSGSGDTAGVIGYFIAMVGSGDLLCVESFGEIVPMTVDNDSIEFTPKIYIR